MIDILLLPSREKIQCTVIQEQIFFFSFPEMKNKYLFIGKQMLLFERKKKVNKILTTKQTFLRKTT